MKKELHIVKDYNFKYGGHISVILKEFGESGFCQRLCVRNGFSKKEDAIEFIESEYPNVEVIDECAKEDN